MDDVSADFHITRSIFTNILTCIVDVLKQSDRCFDIKSSIY